MVAAMTTKIPAPLIRLQQDSPELWEQLNPVNSHNVHILFQHVRQVFAAADGSINLRRGREFKECRNGHLKAFLKNLDIPGDRPIYVVWAYEWCAIEIPFAVFSREIEQFVADGSDLWCFDLNFEWLLEIGPDVGARFAKHRNDKKRPA